MEFKANEKQIGGGHYKDNVIQPWDFIIENKLGFLEGNIIKYIVRYAKKGGIEDLEKAQHYLDKLKEVQQAKAPSTAYSPNLGNLYGASDTIDYTELLKKSCGV